jgi:hypothetical protein
MAEVLFITSVPAALCAVNTETPTTMSDEIAARAALSAAKALTQEKREALRAASAALERAKATAADLEREVVRRDAEEAAWITRHSQKIQDWIAGGGQGTRPAAVADIKAAQAKLTAAANATAAREAVERFLAAESAAREDLAIAEAEVAAAEFRRRQAEDEELAEQVEHLLSQASRLGAELRQRQPNELDMPLNSLAFGPLASARVRSVLERLGRLEAKDGLDIPLRELPRSPEALQEAAA